MQYIINGFDGSDVLEKRMLCRSDHLALIEDLKKQGKILYACAYLDDNNKMIGSMIISNFDTREDLENYLKIEPYVTGGVWEKVEVLPCKVAPIFEK